MKEVNYRESEETAAIIYYLLTKDGGKMSEIIKNESYKLLKYLEMKRQKELLKTKAQESNA